MRSKRKIQEITKSPENNEEEEDSIDITTSDNELQEVPLDNTSGGSSSSDAEENSNERSHDSGGDYDYDDEEEEPNTTPREDDTHKEENKHSGSKSNGYNMVNHGEAEQQKNNTRKRVNISREPNPTVQGTPLEFFLNTKKLNFVRYMLDEVKPGNLMIVNKLIEVSKMDAPTFVVRFQTDFLHIYNRLLDIERQEQSKSGKSKKPSKTTEKKPPSYPSKKLKENMEKYLGRTLNNDQVVKIMKYFELFTDIVTSMAH